MVKQPSEGFFKKGVMRNFAEFTRTSVPESLFWCFLVNFAEFVRTPFLQNSTGRLLLIRAVSIVAKRILANETVNYDTQISLEFNILTQVFSKCLKKPFFKEFHWLLLKFLRNLEQKPVRLSGINTRFNCKKVFAAAKIQKQPP